MNVNHSFDHLMLFFKNNLGNEYADPNELWYLLAFKDILINYNHSTEFIKSINNDQANN